VLTPFAIMACFKRALTHSKHHSSTLVSLQIQQIATQLLASRAAHSVHFFGVLLWALGILRELASQGHSQWLAEDQSTANCLLSLIELSHSDDDCLLESAFSVLEAQLHGASDRQEALQNLEQNYRTVERLIKSTSLFNSYSPSPAIAQVFFAGNLSASVQSCFKNHQSLQLRLEVLVSWLNSLHAQPSFLAARSRLHPASIFRFEYLDYFTQLLETCQQLVQKLQHPDPVCFSSVELLQVFLGQLKIKLEVSRPQLDLRREGQLDSRAVTADLVNAYIERLNALVLFTYTIVQEFSTDQETLALCSKLNPLQASTGPQLANLPI
jgi:hypothetical protein